ncbi:hypothetical protein halTADL_2166 [Halohasta litchfieldiae]|jgi:hypothetical protein|uniref:Uncharacterized protein n=1 Tax=Halohasta litchfieldiae TaxID=1073996 RepID=A0A1H6TM17_9EURY|nr:hypothetical protein halTADL_2166 [Halohasta litchfieldiae]SEI81031.1 hypothetical protein SAMN05444271_108127 [Halohasta litchfieldiae]
MGEVFEEPLSAFFSGFGALLALILVSVGLAVCFGTTSRNAKRH